MRFSFLPLSDRSARSLFQTSGLRSSGLRPSGLRVSGLTVAALLLCTPGLHAQDAAAPAQGTQSAAQPAAQGAQSAQGDTPAAAPAPVAKKKRKFIQKDEPAKGSKAAQTADKKQAGEPSQTAEQTSAPATANDTAAATPEKKNKLHIAKDERVKPTKDTVAELRREKKYNPLVGKDADLPDKQLYDKALVEEKKGHFDVARLDMQTLLSTYPESQYLMRTKLAYANAWFQEGGSAALAQAEQEYNDFITFFPNAPEAAEAQMRMGDIYLKQMDVPDRDYSKAIKAEAQYRIMMKTYPDAPPAVHKEAEQKLRDVQEVLAQREFDLAQFYALRNNMAAGIARYQTVIDTYPLFSHMDDTLIGLGDAYETNARNVRAQPICQKGLTVPCLPEAAKARLEEEYDGKAAAAYRTVVLDHAAAPHAEDARERLQGMNLPLPTPTAQQVAASEALEGSRAQYTMRKRLELLLIRKPDTVTAAQVGAPPLEDAPATVAPTIVKQIQADYESALNPAAVHAAAPAAPSPETSASEGPAQPSNAPGVSSPLTLSDVKTIDGSTGTVTEMTPATDTGNGGSTIGNGAASLGAEILTPGVTAGSMTGGAISNRASDRPAATGKADANYGIVAPAQPNNTVLPAAEAAAPAPDAVNEAAGLKQPAAEQKDPNKKKNPKPSFDKNDESSSKHKKKKGVDKINPF